MDFCISSKKVAFYIDLKSFFKKDFYKEILFKVFLVDLIQIRLLELLDLEISIKKSAEI